MAAPIEEKIGEAYAANPRHDGLRGRLTQKSRL
jgi:hypothetical protein